MSRSRLPAILFGLAALGLATGALAQPRPGGPGPGPTPPARGPGPQSGPGAAPPPQSMQGGPPPGLYQQQDGPPRVDESQRVVLSVINLEVAAAGPLTALRVRGLASTMGWQNAVLVPLSRGTPPDGVLDVVLVAEPPGEAMPATGFAPLEAVLLIQPNHPYRGVRVRSATNVLALRTMSGQAEARPPAEDCRSCVGRTLAAAGGGADTINRANLPPGTRILTPTDPLPDLDPNPNRLTLLVGEDGKVAEAVWQ